MYSFQNAPDCDRELSKGCVRSVLTSRSDTVPHFLSPPKPLTRLLKDTVAAQLHILIDPYGRGSFSKARPGLFPHDSNSDTSASELRRNSTSDPGSASLLITPNPLPKTALTKIQPELLGILSPNLQHPTPPLVGPTLYLMFHRRNNCMHLCRQYALCHIIANGEAANLNHTRPRSCSLWGIA